MKFICVLFLALIACSASQAENDFINLDYAFTKIKVGDEATANGIFRYENTESVCYVVYFQNSTSMQCNWKIIGPWTLKIDPNMFGRGYKVTHDLGLFDEE